MDLADSHGVLLMQTLDEMILGLFMRGLTIMIATLVIHTDIISVPKIPRVLFGEMLEKSIWKTFRLSAL